ncbi:MAG: DUF1622 domain-containing protein [Clostridia bacterium]|nr:DUF1622 domain-containing protein [Clostridia bacterium]
METLTAITTHIAQVGIELLDIVAMGILLYGSGKSVWMMIRHWPHVTLSLTRFMNIALIIMLCAEIIRLVLVRTPLELAIVAGMVALHGAISFLISWEVNREQSHDKERGSAEEAEQDVLL